MNLCYFFFFTVLLIPAESYAMLVKLASARIRLLSTPLVQTRLATRLTDQEQSLSLKEKIYVQKLNNVFRRSDHERVQLRKLLGPDEVNKKSPFYVTELEQLLQPQMQPLATYEGQRALNAILANLGDSKTYESMKCINTQFMMRMLAQDREIIKESQFVIVKSIDSRDPEIKKIIEQRDLMQKNDFDLLYDLAKLELLALDFKFLKEGVNLGSSILSKHRHTGTAFFVGTQHGSSDKTIVEEYNAHNKRWEEFQEELLAKWQYINYSLS